MKMLKQVLILLALVLAVLLGFMLVSVQADENDRDEVVLPAVERRARTNDWEYLEFQARNARPQEVTQMEEVRIY